MTFVGVISIHLIAYGFSIEVVGLYGRQAPNEPLVPMSVFYSYTRLSSEQIGMFVPQNQHSSCQLGYWMVLPFISMCVEYSKLVVGSILLVQWFCAFLVMVSRVVQALHVKLALTCAVGLKWSLTMISY